MTAQKGSASLRREKIEVQELRARLEEAEQTLAAITAGHVDALVVHTDHGEQLYTLEGADHPYRVFVESMSEGGITVGSNGVIDYANERFAHMVRAPLESVIGSDARQWIAGEEADLVAVLTEAGEARREMWLLAPDGVRVPVELSSKPLPTDAGEGRRSILIADLTIHREQTEKLRQMNAELEARVAARTHELEEINRELEAFIYSVSHDLKAPLRALDGFSRYLAGSAMERLTASEREDLGRIRTAAKQMSALIEDLLQLSRLNRTEIHMEDVDITALVGEVLRTLAEGQPGRQVEVHVQPGMLAKADRTLLRSALLNLVGNAWKFTSKRPDPRIEVRGRRDDGRYVIEVHDNGAGFDMAFADKLFRPFSRLHAPGQFEGTGIGLASVMRIARRHRGTAWGEGKVDQGATFYLALAQEAVI